MKNSIESTVRRLFSTVAAVFFAAFPCCVNVASSLDPITLQLAEEHQFQFAGYYAAEWNNLYTNAGLSVTVEEGRPVGSPPVDVVAEVVSGRAAFGVASAELLSAHEAGEDLVVLAVVLQRSDVEFYTRESTIVSSPRDLRKLRISSPGGERYLLPINYVMSLAEPEGSAGQIEITSDALEDLAEFRTDMIIGSSLTTPYLAEKIDLDLVSIDPASFGFHAPGQTIFTTREFLRKNPQTVDRFVQASLDGWEYALKNSDEVSLLIARKKLSKSTSIQSSFGMGFYQVDRVRQLAMYPVVRLGSTSASRWRDFHQTIASVVNFNRPLEVDFVRDPYETLKNRVERIDFYARVGLALLFFTVLCTFGVYLVRRSQWIKYERKLRDQATYDALTGLPNRAYALEELECWLEQRQKQPFHVIFLDLDGFKAINDTSGHASGDRLLVQVSERLQQSLSPTDWVARIGGDEFLVLSRATSVDPLTGRLLNCLRDPIVIDGSEHHIGVSIGVARYPDDGHTGQLLLSHADAAMYRAKDSGKNQIFYYAKELGQITEEKTNIGNRLKGALQRGEFYLCYQPIVCIRTNKIRGVEALLRWQNPDLGFVPPDKFIPIAEEIGVINDIGKWVMSAALFDMKRWNNRLARDIYVSVNVSARQFYQSNFDFMVNSLLRQLRVAPELLKIEITESLLVGDLPETSRMLNQFADSGVQIFMDDFGTGFSSLSYLKKFPVQVIKIDRSFTNGLPSDKKASSLVNAIVAMARGLEMHVVCEGVETDAQREFLKNIGCDLAQGYHYSKPVGFSQLCTLLQADQLAELPEKDTGRLQAA